MDDLRRRFGSLDRVPAPYLWTDIESRAMAFDSAGYAVVGVRRRSSGNDRRRRSPLVVIATAALLLALLAGLTILIGAQLRDAPRVVTLEGTFTPAAPMAIERTGTDILAIGLADGRVLVMGGQTDGNEQRDIKQAEIFDPATRTFSPTGTMVEAHGVLTSVTLLADGRVLIAGGWHPTEQGDQALGAELYDPTTGEFTSTGPMAMSRYGHTGTLLPDGRVLIAGGDVSVSGNDLAAPPAELFDPATRSFTAIGPLAVDRLYHTATRLADGRVLLVGGSLARADAEVFDPASGTFTRVGDLGQGRSNHTATLLQDGRVLVAGGVGDVERGDSTLASAESFDPATGTFRATGPLTSARSGHDAVRLRDGRVLVTGGYNFDGPPRSGEIFDPSADRFTLAGLARRTGEREAIALPDGRVLVVGGDPPVGEQQRPPPLAEIFDVAGASTVTVVARPPSSGVGQPVPGIDDRLHQSATLLADGRVLIAGGSELDWRDSWGKPLSSAVIYDPQAGSVTPTGSLQTPRALHAATLLADGRVLIAGGDGPGRVTNDPNDLYDPLASIEIYDPATGQFSDAGSMASRRGPSYGASGQAERPFALLLADGRVLLAGGVTGGGAPQDLPIEIHDLTTGASTAPPGECASGLGRTGVGQALPDGRVLLACGDNALLFDPRSDPIGRRIATDWPDDWGIRAVGMAVLTAGGTGPVVAADPRTGSTIEVEGLTGRPPLTEELGEGSHVQVVVRLHDGRVLVVGRSYEERTRGVAAVIDPATGDVTRLELLAARSWPVVTVLADGRVLITGRPYGSPDHYEPRPPSAELLDPSRVP